MTPILFRFKLLSESCILLSLFSFVKPFETNRDVRDWTISQFEELQLHAMSALCILIPILLKDYFECRGSNIVLQFLEWCTNDKSNNSNNFDFELESKRSKI